MESLSEEELAAEIERRQLQLARKRQIQQDSGRAEKRLKLLEELRNLDRESESAQEHRGSSTSSSSSSNPSPSTIALAPVAQATVVIAPTAPIVEVAEAAAPKQKNCMLAYWSAKETNAVDVEILNEKRVADAKANSESRQTENHRDRKGHVGSQVAKKDTGRPCTISTWNVIKKKLSETDKILITHNTTEKRIWCAACPCFIRDDNLQDHVSTAKHIKAAKITLEDNLHQSNLEFAIKSSKSLSIGLCSRTHLFRSELVRTLLTAALPIKKADDWRQFLEKWVKVESTDSSNLLTDYLPIIMVTLIYFKISK